ncbi:MAG: glycosyltransferase [Rubrivivax sp.]
MMRVLVVAADPASTLTQLRVGRPLSAGLAEQAGELRLRPLHDVPLAALRACDVLVMQRGMSRRHLHLMKTAAAMGRAVIYEIDDLLTEPAPHLQHADALRRGAPWVRACLDAADVVTVSTERLASMLELQPERRVVVANAAFDGPAGPTPEHRASGAVSLLVAASDRVAGGAAWPALQALTRAAGGAVSVQAVGPVADDLERAGVACRRLPPMPREAFVRWAATQPNPIALIPLDDSRFSAGKSAIKWFDYAVAGVPTLASDLPPYNDVIEHARTGWLVRPGVVDWQHALTMVIGDAALRTRLAAAARQQVLGHHHAGLTRRAWGEALHIATARAAARGGARGQLPLLQLQLRHAMQELGLSLRRWNRERLARRG